MRERAPRQESKAARCSSNFEPLSCVRARYQPLVSPHLFQVSSAPSLFRPFRFPALARTRTHQLDSRYPPASCPGRFAPAPTAQAHNPTWGSIRRDARRARCTPPGTPIVSAHDVGTHLAFKHPHPSRVNTRARRPLSGSGWKSHGGEDELEWSPFPPRRHSDARVCGFTGETGNQT